jgi:hypothetical protein
MVYFILLFVPLKPLSCVASAVGISYHMFPFIPTVSYSSVCFTPPFSSIAAAAWTTLSAAAVYWREVK